MVRGEKVKGRLGYDLLKWEVENCAMGLVVESTLLLECAKTAWQAWRERCPRQSKRMVSEDPMHRDFRMRQTQEGQKANHHMQMLSL